MTSNETCQQVPAVEVRHLSKLYRMGDETVIALRDVNISIAQGEICCIFGTSGSGKSTLLNMLAGMEKPSKGEVIINGATISQLSENQLSVFRQENIGFVFQSYNLLPMLTALENVAMPLMFHGVSKPVRQKAAASILKQCGLGNRMDHYPGQMSGGQQQRAGIARAFVAKPKIVFADEPTGNLDTKTTKEIMDMIVGFARRHHQTIILVTHDPELAQYADRIITLIDGRVMKDQKGNAT